MSNPDWTEAPDDATHWDALGACFCNEQGWWLDEKYITANQLDWGDSHYIPRPTDPATTTWNGTGLPPVGTVCEKAPSWHKVEILASHDDELVVYDFHNLAYYKVGLSMSFRPIRTQRERDEFIDFAARAYLSDRLESAPNLSGEQARKIAAFFYDAGMLKLPKATA